MKKRCFKYIFAFILLIIVIMPNKSWAITSAGDYTIENYDIDMVVNEDNTFNITENITVYFSARRHRNI